VSINNNPASELGQLTPREREVAAPIARGLNNEETWSILARLRAVIHLARAQSGQDVVEYGIIIATIAVVILLGMTTFGNQITPWFAQLAGHITTVGT